MSHKRLETTPFINNGANLVDRAFGAKLGGIGRGILYIMPKLEVPVAENVSCGQYASWEFTIGHLFRIALRAGIVRSTTLLAAELK